MSPNTIGIQRRCTDFLPTDETTAGRKKSPAGSSGEGGVKYDHPEQGGH